MRKTFPKIKWPEFPRIFKREYLTLINLIYFNRLSLSA